MRLILIDQYIMISSIKKLRLLLLLIIIVEINGSLSVEPNTNILKDQHNRFRVMHGVNVVFKQFPYYPIRTEYNSNGSLVKQDFLKLKSWGINSIRLYMAWQGFQPKPKEYNYSYLLALRDIVRQAETYGISIIIDAHHDLYSKRFCGQGFPDWLVTSYSFPAPFKVDLRRDSAGNPLKQDCLKMPFFKYYISYDVVSFSHDFFTNKHGMNDKFIEMWTKVVDYFKNQTNVIGYDILNEPTGGNFWKNPYAFIGPDQNNNRLLLPFYRKISKELRKIEKEKLFMFEPSPVDMIGGFLQNFSDFSSKDLLNYHTYCPFQKNLGGKKCKMYNYLYIKRRQNNIKGIGVGGIITEFGSVPNTAEGRAQIKDVLQNADKYLTSWYYWQYKYNMDSTCSTNPPWLHSFYYPNGTLQIQKIKTLAYSYAYAICGKVLNQTHSQGSYSLSIIPLKCLNGKNTEVFLNEQFDFPNGYAIKFTPNCDQCRLKFISKGYYELIIDESFNGKAFTFAVGAKIS